MSPPADHGRLLEEMDRLLTDLENVKDVRTREKARAVVRAVLDVHGAGLARIRDILTSKGQSGWAVLNECARDPLVQSLFILHEVHPDPLNVRVDAGLERVATFLRLNKSTVEIVSLVDERLRLRICFDPATCQTTPERLKSAVEQALVETAPDVEVIEIQVVSQMSSSAASPPQEVREVS